MGSKASFLILDKVQITPQISIKIPTVGEILRNEQSYYCLTTALTASPFTYMVQLDNMGIDYTSIDDWQLFLILFNNLAEQVRNLQLGILDLKKHLSELSVDTFEYIDCQAKTNILQRQIDNVGISMVFGDTDIAGFVKKETDDKEEILFNPITNAYIDKAIYTDIASTIRKINLYKHVKSKPGNEHMKEYLLKKERRRMKRHANKPYEPYLENMVVALVNNADFPYDYDSCLDLSIYRFNQSAQQIQHKISFDNTMIGVYAGTIDTSKMKNKDSLSWIKLNK